ncbi:Potassium channel [Linnemannia zychae]|nr:Potassium channel [Linnemannia zychae]
MLASSPQLYSPLSPYSSQSPPLTSINEKNTHTDNTNNSNSSRSSKSNLLAADSTATHDSSKPLLNIRPILSEGHRLVDSSEFGSESYEDEKNDIRLSTSITPRRHRDSSPLSHKISKDTRPITENTTRSIGRGSGTESDLQSSGTHSTISPDSSIGPPIDPNQPRPRLAQVGPHIATATIQAYNFLTVVRSIADPTWMVLKTSNDKSGAQDDGIHLGTIGKFEIIFLALSVVCSLLSCIGFTLRVMDRMSWIRKVPIITSYLQAGFAIVALVHYHATTKLLPGAQYAHGYLTCVLTIVLSCLVTIIMTVDWFRGFPNPGLSVVLKELIISSFVMTVVIIVAAGTYTLIEGWSFDTSVNFCIVSFSTIGYGNVSPQTVAGRVVFFFYGVIGISAVGYFIVSLRNAVLEQFQWRLIERFSKPSHIIRVQTRMSTRDMSFPLARFEEEQRVKKMDASTKIEKEIILLVIFPTFKFVTLTTVGFGDMAPTEPGSIEFWNIYVFLGLTVFAYILSLFSDTMASHIHLVDDGDEPDDDDDMYGWEHCEDASNLFANWNGAMGMDGLKWTQQQTLIHANRGQENQHQDNESSVIPGQQGHNDRPKGLQRFRFWKQITNKNNNDGGESGGGGGYGVNEGRLGQQSTTSEHSMDTWHQQKQRARAQRHLSSGRILMVPAKERKQMLEAEYYATHNDPSFDHTNINTAGSTSETTEQNMEEPLERFVRSVPTTIRFVDKFGYPHRRVIGQHINNNHGGVQATSSQQSGATLGTESSGSQGTSIANTTAEGSASEDDRLHPRQRQRYVYSTTGYNDVLTKRRGTLAAMRQQHNYGHRRGGGHRNARSDGYDGKFGNDQDQRWLSSSSSSQFIQNQYPHYQDETIQTGALKHQPTVRFESPYIRHGNGEGSSSSTTPHRAMLQRAFQQQHLQQNQQHQDSWERQQAQSQDHPLSTMDPNNHVIATSDLQPNEDTENEKRDRFITPYSIDYENNDNYTMATTDAFERYLDLDHTRQSHSSDVTKVGSPAAEIYLGEPSPFFANNPKAKAVTSPTTSQLQQRRESELIPGTGIQTPPNSQPATKRLERENEVGPFGETKNSADLPIFDTKVDLNLMGYEAMEQQKQLQEQRRRDPSDPQSPASPIEMQQTSSSMEAAITNTVNAHHVGITMPAAMGLTLGTRSSGVKCHQNGLSGSTSTFDHDFAESDICLVPLNLNAYDVPKAASSVDYTNNNNNNNITNSTNNCTSIGVTIDSETTQNQAISMSKTENASPFSSIRQLLSPPAEPVTPSSLTSFPFSSASSSFSSNNNCSLSKDNNNTKTKGKLPSATKAA